MPLLTTGAGKYPVAVAGGITYTPTDAKQQNVAFGNPSTITGVAIGTASSDRIVVAMIGSSLAGITGVTIGGVTATKAIGDGGTDAHAIWYANVPTGTTATFVITGAGPLDNIVITVGALAGQTGGGGAAPTHTAFDTFSFSNPFSIPMTVDAGGIGICGVYAYNNNTIPPTWSGTTNANGDENINTVGGNNAGFESSAHITSSGTPTITTSAGGVQGIYAAWAA